jgi:hypothetical protein
VQSIDSIILKSAITIRSFSNKRSNWLQKFLDRWLLFLPYKFIFNHRINERLIKLSIPHNVFWQNCTKLITKSVYEKADYWNLMHTLFEGLTALTLFWSLFYLIHYSFFPLLTSLGLTTIFWYRAKNMADNFIRTVNDTISSL